MVAVRQQTLDFFVLFLRTRENCFTNYLEQADKETLNILYHFGGF